MKASPEIRTYKGGLEFRAASDGASIGTLVGYAAKFNKQSRNLGGFVEQLAPTAFNKSLADGVRVMARYNHEDNGLLGTTDAGTLRLEVDDIGLRYEVDLPDTTVGRDVAALAARGDVRFSSFAFHVPPGGDEWGYTDSDFPLRTVRAAHLVDVAPVNDPAYLDTTSGLRSLAEARGLDLAIVRDHAARDELRVLLKKDMDGEPTPEPAAPVADEATPEAPTDAERAASLDVARRRLELLRVPR